MFWFEGVAAADACSGLKKSLLQTFVRSNLLSPRPPNQKRSFFSSFVPYRLSFPPFRLRQPLRDRCVFPFSTTSNTVIHAYLVHGGLKELLLPTFVRSNLLSQPKKVLLSHIALPSPSSPSSSALAPPPLEIQMCVPPPPLTLSDQFF